MKFRYALVAASMLASPFAAKAQPIDGLYMGLGAGVNIMQDENVTVTVPPPLAGASGKLKTRVGPAVDLSVGYRPGNGLRAEVESNYRFNSFSGTSGEITRAAARSRNSA